MNRIYQGRVTGVEIPLKITLPPKGKGKLKSEIRWLPFHTNQKEAQRLLDELKPGILGLGKIIGDLIAKRQKAKAAEIPEQSAEIAKDITKAKIELRELRKKLDEPWQTALWEHHQLFQDMVNYYTVALAAMAEGEVDKAGESTAMADFAAQVKERWQNFTHKGKGRAGLRKSLCRTLGLADETSTWEICTKKILEGALKHFPDRKDAKGIDVFHRVIAEMYPEKSRGNPKTMSASDWPWLCWKNVTGETPAKSYYRKNRGIRDFLSELFNADEKELAKLAKKEVTDTFLTSVEQADDDDGASTGDAQSPNDQTDELPEQETARVERFIGIDAITKLRTCIDTARSLLAEDTFKTQFPDQNAKLLVALRRAQSFAGRLHRWCWFFSAKEERKDQAQRQRTAIKEIAETDPHQWLPASTHEAALKIYEQIKDKKEAVMPTLDPRIAGTMAEQLGLLMKNLSGWLEIIANRVYHSRRGRFVWRKHPGKSDCHLLDFEEWNEEERKKITKGELMLNGQRGLSIERIEQMEELRKRCQSLNQMVRRNVGEPPLKTRDDSIPDPCPAILAKLDNIKEQRRNQTAHMILVEALGLRLREPVELTTTAERKLAEAKDQHGEYEKADARGWAISPDKPNDWRGVVDFIVIEDLTRYRTTQGRAPRENSRLMKWCHRAIRDKLKEMCQPFGIPLIETPAAYSSRFCSRSGVAGFRATELSPSMLNESKWRWRVKKREDGKEETNEQRERREQWEAVFAKLRTINEGRDGITKGREYRTLLVPDAGGSVFIPMAALDEDYQRPAKDSTRPKLARPIVQYRPVSLEMDQIKTPRLIHADINAAVNLGLRAVADPKVWSIHSRLRSERELGSPIAAKAKKTKRTKKAASSIEEEQNLTPVEGIRPDKFFAKEKRKHGSRAEAKGVEIVILTVGRALDESAKATDEQSKRHWMETAQKETPKASDSRHPNFFADTANFNSTHWGAAKMHPLLDDDTHPTHLVSGKALWSFVKGQEWKRIAVINSARIAGWKHEQK